MDTKTGLGAEVTFLRNCQVNSIKKIIRKGKHISSCQADSKGIRYKGKNLTTKKFTNVYDQAKGAQSYRLSSIEASRGAT